ncbi:MAG: SusC/RagA family TonB-linked outer membrane protein [Chitinophagaceae bacterium]
MKNEPLQKVFLLIEQQSGYNFIYSAEQLAHAKPITLAVTDESLSSTLSRCFSGQPLRYAIDNKHILVIEKPTPPDRIIKGQVVNESSDPVAGVSVSIKGTNLVTSSDAQGNFELKDAPDMVTLIVSGAEMETVEYALGTSTRPITLKIERRLGVLSETVIKGYYETSRKLNTGTVGIVKSKEIERQPVSNPLAALQGRVTGLFITQSNGVSGSQFSVLIRGRNSLQSGVEPLYVVDGIIFNGEALSQRSSIAVNSPFNTLVPEDIESVQVLKDGDATALYGSRGGNGVILIQTKKGKVSKPQLDVSFSQGWGKVTRTMDYLDTQEYVAMRREAFKNDGITPTVANSPDLFLWDTTRYTNWKKELIGGTTRTSNVQLRYSGGSKLTSYSVSSNYYRESALFPGKFKDERVVVAASLSTRSENNKLQFSLTGNYGSETNDLPIQDASNSIRLQPNAPLPFDGDNKLVWKENGNLFDNPFAYILRTYSSTQDRLTANTWISYMPFSGFSVKASGGINRLNLDETSLTPIASQDPSIAPTGKAAFASNDLHSWIVELQAEYTTTILKDIRIKALAGSSWQSSTTAGTIQAGSGYTSDVLLNTVSGAATVTNTDSYSDYKYHGLFARLELNRKDKLILNLTGRTDGSSRFGPGNRYGNFGAVGVGWIFSDETFFKKLQRIMNFGKFRLSYGITGNDQIGNYQYYDLYSTTRNPFQNLPALRPSRLFNPAYNWEQKYNWDLGFEAGFLKSNILLNVTYFRSVSGNQILQYSLPGQTGFPSILSNFPGKVENKGWEIDITTTNIKRSKFTWRSSFNITIPKNTLLAFPGLETSSYASTYVVGQPVSIRKLYDFIAIDSLTGVYKFRDANRDGSINSNDRTAIRHTLPRFYGGFGNDLSFGNFELSIFFQFVKQDGVDPVIALFLTQGRQQNEPEIILDRWQKPGDVARYQRFSTGSGAAFTAASQAANSTAAITDASYIRLKNASLSYKLPVTWISRAGMRSATLFVQGQNLLTITDYIGADPENQSTSAIPPLRMLSFGARVTF